jgi:predicted Rossmann fold flavoprotein
MGLQMKEHGVIVVGGGAAGLMAAGQAAALGADTLLLEKKARPGRKLSITGKGRCNLTNISPLPDFIAHYGKNGRFLRQAFNRFFSTELMDLLRSLGIKTVTESDGRVFPADGNAEAVVDALVQWAKQQGVSIKTTSPVEQLLIGSDGILGVRADGRDYHAGVVIIATGGASYPATGSTGDGYRLAASAGHTIIPIRPALVPLETAGDVAGRLQGVSLRNVKVSIYMDGRKHNAAAGNIMFAHFGLSGPMILTLSGSIVDALHRNKKITLSIDLMPDMDERELEARLLGDLQVYGRRQFHTMLKGLLPSKLIPVCCDLTGIPPEKVGHQINAEERRRLRTWLKDFRFAVIGHRPLEEATVTAGGVDTREVDPRTMASRLIRGLYFAGEVLDIAGDTGGYNLQAAFSTGWLAGHSAAGQI